MASDLAVYQFPDTGHPIRGLDRDGDPWVVGADACAALDISNPRSSLALLDEDEKDVHTVDTPGGPQQMVIVNESGLYALILRSRKPEAKRFKRWITHEVLPAIRKTGRYQIEPMDELELAERNVQLIKDKRALLARAMRAEQTLAIAAPKADAWEVLASAEGDYAVREAAYILNRDPAIRTGMIRLFRLLREWKMIDRNDVPYQKHDRHVVLRPTSYIKPSGKKVLEDQVRITVNGLSYIHKKMGGTMRFSQLIEGGPEPEMSIALPPAPEEMPVEQEALFEVDPQ